MIDSGPDWGEPRVLETAGSRIHYWITGPETGPLVVLTHGASMNHHMFDPQCEPLTDRGYRVLGWDIRGHGHSKPIGESFSVSRVADDLAAMINMVGAKGVTLVGHSFGGYVSQQFYYSNPEMVRALVVLGSTDITRTLPRRYRFLMGLSPHFLRVWPDVRRRHYVAKYTAKRPAVKAQAYSATSQLSKKEFIAVWSAVADCYYDEPSASIDCPFLLAHGEDDVVGPIAAESKRWAEAAPDVEYAVIPDAGHNANQDNPEAFNEALLSFLGEHVPTSAVERSAE